MTPLVVEPEIYTQNDLEQLSAQGARYELIRGELKTMSPAGGGHGSVTMELCILVGGHIIANKLGKTFAAETGFVVKEEPRTILAPDFAFIVKSVCPIQFPIISYRSCPIWFWKRAVPVTARVTWLPRSSCGLKSVRAKCGNSIRVAKSSPCTHPTTSHAPSAPLIICKANCCRDYL